MNKFVNNLFLNTQIIINSIISKYFHNYTNITIFFSFLFILIYFYLLIFNKKKKGNNSSSKKSNINRFYNIYKNINEVTKALEKSGLESSNLIIGIDFTSSNLTKGEKTFKGKSLHTIENHDDSCLNPYQKVIEIVGRTLEKFDEDKMIPCYGFGDITTKDHSVFAFIPEMSSNRFCHGFNEILQVYKYIAPNIKLSGPTNFSPLIYESIKIVSSAPRTEYHILVIVCDGEVVSERETIQAIQDASNWPISIIVVGVGDGPWDMMEYFDDKLRNRKFDNFNFVNYHEVIQNARKSGKDPDVIFALQALMEIPQQYKAIRKLGLLGKKTGNDSGETPTCYDFSRCKPMPLRDIGVTQRMTTNVQYNPNAPSLSGNYSM